MTLSPSEARLRRVAGMLKIHPEVYRLHIAAGEKWCSGHRDWHDPSAFGVRRSKPDGLMTICREAEARRSRIAMRRVHARRLAASGTVVRPRRRGPRCVCGDVLVEATRYEAERTISVRLCLACGAETPPLYDRSARARNGYAHDGAASCARCGAGISQRYDGTPAYCSLACRPAPATAYQRRAS